MADVRLNLGGVSALVVDSDDFSLCLVRQILRGFGVGRQAAFDSAADAMEYLTSNTVDICVFEANLKDQSGFDLVKWVRRHEDEATRFVPVLILTGFTEMRNVKAARDCGANIIVKKPISPQILFDHIAWCAASKRPFLHAGPYIGPDRRFQQTTMPPGQGRRADDKPAEGEAGADTGVKTATAI